MDNDIFIPYKFRASQIVGIAKVAVKFIEANGLKFTEIDPHLEPYPYAKLNKIQWFNQSQGKIRAFIQGLNILNKEHYLEMVAAGGWGNAIISCVSVETEPEGERQAQVTVDVVGRISKALEGRVLLDSEQRSNYVQLHSAAPKNIRMINGLVQNTGAIIFGTGYTVARIGVGIYNVTLNQGMPAGYTVTGNDAQAAGRVFSYSTGSATLFQVIMRNGQNLVPEDIAFSFCVIGSA